MKKNSTPMLDEHLELLQQMQEVDTDAFFYTRLRARMEYKNDTDWILPLKPVWLLGSLVVLLLINGFMLRQEWEVTKKTPVSTIQEFAKSYDQTIITPY
jgi:hypothetical protein